MKQKILLLTGVFVFLLFANQIFAQTKITGKVTSETGEEIPGATVRVKGTSLGTITDLDGMYTVEVPEGSEALIFSFIGMITQEIPVSGTVINCILLEDTEELEEVIVVGYGTMKKTDKTGAVSNVTADELNKGVLTDPIQALQGKAAGVVISKSGGDPNGGFSVKIRGSSSLTSSTDPLYVVDGIPGVDPTTIASEDIESFNILKDASSTAIYGTRGANGVIIITTKKGASGGTKVDFNNYLSFDNVVKKLDFLSAEEYRDYVEQRQLLDTSFNWTDNGASTDWQDEIYRQGISQNYNLSVSGGDENTTYYSSVSHNDLQGVLIGTDKVRSIARMNLTQTALKGKLTIQTNIAGTREENNYVDYSYSPKGVIYQAFQRNPTDPVYDSLGNFFQGRDEVFNYNNPVALIENITNYRKANRISANLKADLEIIDGLVLSGNFGYVRNDESYNYSENTETYRTTTLGIVSGSMSNYENKLLETTLSYDKTIATNHNITLLAGYSFQEGMSNGFNAYGTDLMSNSIIPWNLGAANSVVLGNIGGYKDGNRLISFFGRATYNFGSKYYLTGTIRRDGSSRFGDNNKWGYFPSVSGGWTISNESFLENSSVISLLKLRAGYGISGNQEIGNKLSFLYYSVGGTTVNPETGETVVNFTPQHDPNPDLQWEETSELNIGIDFGFFDNKVSGSLEYYLKETSEMLYCFRVPQPPSITGWLWYNADGIITNNGLELNLQYYAVSKKNFDWNTSLTFTQNTQDVKGLEDLEGEPLNIELGGISGRGMTSMVSQYLAPGFAPGTFYMPEYAGVSDDGQFLFYTEAGGMTRNWADAELRNVGSAQPKFTIGWSNSLTFFDRVDLSFSARFVYRFYQYNVTRMMFGSVYWIPDMNVLQTALDDEQNLGLNDNPEVSSYYLEDATFLRFDNINLGYTFNTENITWISKARIYFSGTNLITLTKYTGLDPELSYNGLSFGIDNYNVYPKTRSVTVGVNVTF